MALTSLNTGLKWPGITNRISVAPSFATSTTVDASGEYGGVVIAAREAMTISHVGFRTGTCTGSPTADVRIETVGTDGLPTGALWATNTNIVTATLVTNAWALHALTASASISAGQSFAVLLKYNSGTSFITQRFAGFTSSVGLPYLMTNTGTPTKAIIDNPLLLALGSGTTTFYSVVGLAPATAATANTFNNTNGARRGVRFQVPFPCRCVGFRIYEGTELGDKNAILFNDAGTELSSSSTAYEGDVSALSGAGCQEYQFDNPVTLAAATWYRAVIEPTSATNCSISTATLPSLSYRSAWPGGTNFFYTTYASAAWDDTATAQVPFMDIIIDQLDDGASVASGPVGSLKAFGRGAPY